MKLNNNFNKNLILINNNKFIHHFIILYLNKDINNILKIKIKNNKV